MSNNIENLLTGGDHDLKNRYMHIDHTEDPQSANSEILKCNNYILEELVILKEIANDPSITPKSLAEAIGKSERTVKSRTVELQEKNSSVVKTESVTVSGKCLWKYKS